MSDECGRPDDSTDEVGSDGVRGGTQDHLHGDDPTSLLFDRLRDELDGVDPARVRRDLALLHAAGRSHAHRPARPTELPTAPTWRRRAAGLVGAAAFKLVATTAAAAAATGGLASVGRLPAPLQQTVSAAAANVGLDVPTARPTALAEADRADRRAERVVAAPVEPTPTPLPRSTPVPEVPPRQQQRPASPSPTSTPARAPEPVDRAAPALDRAPSTPPAPQPSPGPTGPEVTCPPEQGQPVPASPSAPPATADVPSEPVATPVPTATPTVPSGAERDDPVVTRRTPAGTGRGAVVPRRQQRPTTTRSPANAVPATTAPTGSTPPSAGPAPTSTPDDWSVRCGGTVGESAEGGGERVVDGLVAGDEPVVAEPVVGEPVAGEPVVAEPVPTPLPPPSDGAAAEPAERPSPSVVPPVSSSPRRPAPTPTSAASPSPPASSPPAGASPPDASPSPSHG